MGRVFLVSNVLDALYGTLPAPFFVVDGKTAPDLMMDRIPGVVLVAVAVVLAIGIGVLGSYLDMFVASLIPIFVHWVLFLGHGWPKETEKLFDLAGQIGFTAMNLYSYFYSCRAKNRRQSVTSFLLLLWSVRLGLFLFLRFLERKSDFRFLRTEKVGYRFFAWTNQGIWCFLQGLPFLVILGNDNRKDVNFSTVDLIGWVVFFYGLFVESVADLQKLSFVRKYNREKRPFINEGLWRFSRHANFSGESTVHIGIFISCLNSFLEPWHFLVGIVGPIFSFVFLMQTSVPWLEFLADKRYGHSKEYQQYKRRTSAYWLLPPRPDSL